MIDAEAIKRDFPSLEGKIYLNTAAEGIPPLAVGHALQQYLADKLTGMDGREPHFRVETEAREITAHHLGLKPQEIAFCSCSAEAYNLLASALALEPDDEVVISDLDFPSGATPWLAAHGRPAVRLWQSHEGGLRMGDLSSLLGSKTRLVQVSLVSFYNGYRLPWAEFLETVRRSAPQAVIAVDVTQALGRIPLDCTGADILISSTHKWTLGIHGGGIVGIPAHAAERLTTRAGGWYHLKNAFSEDRFERAEIKPGAASFAVGMPSFAPIYALNAALRSLAQVGIEAIARHADPLVAQVHRGFVELGLTPMAPFDPCHASGIVAFRHPEAEAIHAQLRAANIHVMYHAGRIRASIHGYNSANEVEYFLKILGQSL